MRPGRGEADDGIPGAHPRTVDDRVPLHDADAESGEIVILALVHAGHLRGLASDQREVYVLDRKSTRLNSSHGFFSYAVFCLIKKKTHLIYTSLSKEYYMDLSTQQNVQLIPIVISTSLLHTPHTTLIILPLGPVIRLFR